MQKRNGVIQLRGLLHFNGVELYNMRPLRYINKIRQFVRNNVLVHALLRIIIYY